MPEDNRHSAGAERLVGVWAISEGREAARAVDEFLMGESVLEMKEKGMLALR